VLVRPPNVAGSRDRSVAPGAHSSEAGPQVVWWDPGALDLEHEAESGLRLTDILKEPPHGRSAAATGMSRYAAWREARSATVADGAAIQRTVYPIAEWSEVITKVLARPHGAPGVNPEAVDVERAEGQPSTRPSGRRFGQLVHEILATVPLDGDDHAVKRVSVAVARRLGASETEQSAAVQAVGRALGTEVLREAARLGPADVLREVPVVLPLDIDGARAHVEGVVDLAFRRTAGEGAEWTVVDFKTDTELAGSEQTYRLQAALYAAALSAVTGEPCRAILLVI
jgi:ATP-dependent exoDNAse (exonuclease V) beta subunit